MMLAQIMSLPPTIVILSKDAVTTYDLQSKSLEKKRNSNICIKFHPLKMDYL